MPVPSADKQRIREHARAARRALPPDEHELLSRAACERLLVLPQVTTLPQGSVVLGYAASAEELDPAHALDALRARGMRIAYPRVSGPGSLSLHECDPGTLEPGPFGIRQPCETATALTASRVAFVIVPGVAFDRTGHRLGYGGGFYDRLLTPMQASLAGIAFDGQLVDEVPVEAHDVRVHWVVTPTRTLRAR